MCAFERKFEYLCIEASQLIIQCNASEVDRYWFREDTLDINLDLENRVWLNIPQSRKSILDDGGTSRRRNPGRSRGACRGSLLPPIRSRLPTPIEWKVGPTFRALERKKKNGVFQVA